jgi:hypothetical protein
LCSAIDHLSMPGVYCVPCRGTVGSRSVIHSSRCAACKMQTPNGQPG